MCRRYFKSAMPEHLVFLLIIFGRVKCDFKLSNNKLEMEVDEIATFKVYTDFVNSADEKNANVILSFESLDKNVIQIMPSRIQASNKCTYDFKLKPLKAGLTKIRVTKNSTVPAENSFVLVKIYKSLIMEWISNAIGWLYFSAWSISFYPQIYTNYKRKSVVGLNFDFLFFNIVGYLMYNAFNTGMHFATMVKEQYSFRHPGSLNPVHPNDIFFSTHGVLATSGTIFQTFIYEKGNQNISVTARTIVGFYFLVTTVYAILASLGTVLWLDVLYVCSYIKLCVTVTKYMPQVYMNYRRKSTQGWSIYAVLLDFSGGILSILQMVLDGYNYDDWTIIVENPTKFGLGILTIGFDLVFAFQHYFLYTIIQNTEQDIAMKTF